MKFKPKHPIITGIAVSAAAASMMTAIPVFAGKANISGTITKPFQLAPGQIAEVYAGPYNDRKYLLSEPYLQTDDVKKIEPLAEGRDNETTAESYKIVDVRNEPGKAPYGYIDASAIYRDGQDDLKQQKPSVIRIIHNDGTYTEYNQQGTSTNFTEQYTAFNGADAGETLPDGSTTFRDVTIDSGAEIKNISYTTAANMINDGESFLMYFGFPDCYYCRYEMPGLTKAAAEKGVAINNISLPNNYWSTARSVYDFPSGVDRTKDNLDKVEEIYKNEEYDDLLAVINQHMAEGNSLSHETVQLEDGTSEQLPNVSRLSAPTVLYFKNGQGRIFRPSNIDFSTPASEETDNQLYEQFKAFLP